MSVKMFRFIQNRQGYRLHASISRIYWLILPLNCS